MQKYKKFSELKNNYPIKEQKNVSETTLTASADELCRIMPPVADSTRFSVLCHRSDYSAARIAGAIEDCEAHVLNINLTADNPGDDLVAVDIRIDRRNVASVSRSLARYGYIVTDIESDDSFGEDDENRRRVNEFLRYLDV